MGLNLIDSLYYTIITMATVGFGDIVPTTALQKIFSMTVALSGVGTIAYVFSGVIQNFTEKLTEYSKGAKMYKKIDKMNNYYRNAIYKSMVLNEKVESWYIDDYNKEDVVITIYTYKGNKLVLHLSYGNYFNIRKLIFEIEQEIERCDN